MSQWSLTKNYCNPIIDEISGKWPRSQTCKFVWTYTNMNFRCNMLWFSLKQHNIDACKTKLFLYHSTQILSYVSIYAMNLISYSFRICRSTCSLLLAHRFLNMKFSVIHIFLCTLKSHSSIFHF